MAKKCSVLKPWRLRNLKFFLSFSCYNFEDTAAYQDTDIFKEKNLSLVQNFIVKWKPNLKVSIYKTEKKTI